jgi:hypothetical protein
MTRLVLNYLYNLGVLASQAVNTIVLFGDPDESLSGRLGKRWHRRQPPAWLPPWFVRHCRASVEWDEGGDSTIRRNRRP